MHTKTDQDIDNESRKRAFNEESTLNDIREDCWKNLEGLEDSNEIVFLISNRNTAKWDFDRLIQAILDVQPLRQKESLTLSLDLLTSRSRYLLKQKVEVLRGNCMFCWEKNVEKEFLPLARRGKTRQRVEYTTVVIITSNFIADYLLPFLCYVKILWRL